MAGKPKKKRNSKDSTGQANGNGEPKKKGGKKKAASKGKSFQCDIFNDATMENAYYVCHNIQDVLKSRGFAWPDGQKKKKKGKH
ncbi:small lysine-rich protein 1 [Episyrphus balteatus]|uniref:small lysine-rich protein 1 n=1 Tax=Episyrphus balteatus TaxID=286459 RepID=UPI002484EEC3|nr:small lysine-rich protein 1 [Episyrphus balteatus]